MGALLIVGLAALQTTDVIDLKVDATDGPRNLLRVTETVPAKPGLFNLNYPKWIPGNHRPSGPINSVLNFHIFANGQEIPWRRDPVELFTIHVRIPDGADSLTVKFVVGEIPGEGWSSTLGRLRWNRVVFLPDGDMHEQQIRAHLTAPAGWDVYSALKGEHRFGEPFEYETVTAERLLDSPAEMGKYFRNYLVAPGHYLDVVAQERGEEYLRQPILDSMSRLVDETGAIFGTRHYRQYHWLATFSDRAAGAGLEHNESCEVGSSEAVLKGDPGLAGIGFLFCHEMFHSWNGKYRRPAGLVHRDYTAPQETELVWIYEGMTEYYGDVLSARAGFASTSMAMDLISGEVSGMSLREGRSWRSVADTAVAASILREGGAWSVDRRQQDYYSESVATWLLVDATIRRLTGDKKSLDDFCRQFEGGEGGKPAVSTYSYEDVVAALNKVAPNDWNAIFQRVVYDVNPQPLTEALTAAGWRMVYNDKPSAGDVLAAMFGQMPDHFSDIGLSIGKSGEVDDMALGSPADVAGFTPGMKILAVSSRSFSPESLDRAIRESPGEKSAIEFTVERDGKLSTLYVAYHAGIRRPHLERVPGTTDYLTEILTPRAKRP